MSLTSCGQSPPPQTDFKPLLQRICQERFDNGFRKSVQFPLPVIYRDSTFGSAKHRVLNFELRLASEPLNLKHQVVRLSEHGYPISYSVVFQNRLVALFKNGKFGCYRLPDLAPDEQLERQLNTSNWQRFWLLDGKLVAQNAKATYFFNSTSEWLTYQQAVPFGRQPKLFEDAHYLAYANCNGGFGGNLYFYNKQTKQTHRANATCANSVWKENGQYRLLASLGHMMGSADCAAIANPDVLPLIAARRDEKSNWQYDFTLPEKGIAPVFSFYGLQLFGGFRWQNQTLYLMHWRRTTFLVTIDKQLITIMDPLFADDLYTHNPVTTSYGPDLALTNLNSYDLGDDNEMATLVWQGKQLTKVEWGKQP